MKAVVFHDIGDVRLDDVDEPKIEEPTDAIIRITASAICGTDLHMIRGTMPGMKPGTILGHEAVGIVEEIGKNVRNLRVGDRVVVPSTIACGACSYCRAGYFSCCDTTDGAFFGGPEDSGGIHGLQAEYARIPFANVGLVKLPDELDDDRAILLSDIFPTGYFGADIAEVVQGDTVAVFGCGPVGQFTIASAKLLGAGRVLAIDNKPDRLEMARTQGAEVINFDEDDPIEIIKELTNGIGVDRAIDAVGVDAERPHHGPAAKKADREAAEFDQEVRRIAPKTNPEGRNWHPGDGPSQVLQWSVEALAKAGTLSIIGVYTGPVKMFPIGPAFGKNLTIQMGGCNHLAYIPRLIEIVMAGAIDPLQVLTKREPLTSVIDAYRAFDTRTPGWVKVELKPAA
jgi:threonine dehydrogenase-like Zn-dependent dehydrogenase